MCRNRTRFVQVKSGPISEKKMLSIVPRSLVASVESGTGISKPTMCQEIPENALPLSSTMDYAPSFRNIQHGKKRMTNRDVS
jgi:hypothetical protein